MKIAVPNNAGQINQHFGQSREFVILEMDGAEIKNQSLVSAADLQHNHSGLAGLLKDQNVDVVILGGIGPGAIEALEHNGFKLFTGITGSIEEAAKACARGELVSRGAVCNHSHGHSHGHSCH